MGNNCTACGCGDQPEVRTDVELNTGGRNGASRDNLHGGSNNASQKSFDRPKNDVYSKG